ncbi:MAG: NAD(P)-binding domain-containing protein, partial [Thiohalospira sp.]
MASVLIVGCGDIGRRTGRRLVARGDEVVGLVRSEASAAAAARAIRRSPLLPS